MRKVSANVEYIRGRECKPRWFFNKVSESSRFSLILVGAPRNAMPAQGPSSRSNTPWIANRPFPRASWSSPCLSECSPLSSLGRALENHREPLLPFTSTGSLSTNLVGGSCKTYKLRIYNIGCVQAPITMRCANLPKSRQTSKAML